LACGHFVFLGFHVHRNPTAYFHAPMTAKQHLEATLCDIANALREYRWCWDF
jgi:hypothetical protein